MAGELRVSSLTMTCEACPAQWEGRLTDGRVIYVRYRCGVLRVGVGRTIDDAVAVGWPDDPRMRTRVTLEAAELIVREQVGDEYDGYMSLSELCEHLQQLAPRVDLSAVTA